MPPVAFKIKFVERFSDLSINGILMSSHRRLRKKDKSGFWRCVFWCSDQRMRSVFKLTQPLLAPVFDKSLQQVQLQAIIQSKAFIFDLHVLLFPRQPKNKTKAPEAGKATATCLSSKISTLTYYRAIHLAIPELNNALDNQISTLSILLNIQYTILLNNAACIHL